MSNQYRMLKARQQEEFNAFPKFFAFSHEQFAEGMRKLGLDPKETDKISALGDTGGFFRKTDVPALKAMFERHHSEIKEAIEADKRGDGFIYDMFAYELANHEYCYTEDPSEALQALRLTPEDIENNPKMRRALKRAMARQK